MIRGQRAMAVAVRRPTGEVAVLSERLNSLYTGRWRRVPLLRGVIILVETLVLGMRALMFSAATALEAEDRSGSERPSSSGTSAVLWATMMVSLLVSIGVFFLGPLLIARGLDSYIGSSVVSTIVEGLIRLAMFLVYIIGIGFWPEIRRVFAYHGAEHMTINAYEAGDPLEVAAVRRHTTAHARCGTAFLLTVMVVAIFVFALVDLARPDWLMKVLSRVVLIPVVAALSYEMIRFHASYRKYLLVRAMAAPSLALQALTTRRPDEKQIEVALEALKRVMQEDGEGPEKPQG